MEAKGVIPEEKTRIKNVQVVSIIRLTYPGPYEDGVLGSVDIAGGRTERTVNIDLQRLRQHQLSTVGPLLYLLLVGLTLLRVFRFVPN